MRKNIMRNVLVGTLSVVLSGLLMQGCSASNPEGNAGDTIQAPVLSVAALTVTGTTVDAATGAAVEGVKLTYSGPGAADIMSKTDVTLAGGVAVFTSSKKTTLVNILASKDGYIDTGIQVNVADVNSSTYTIKMIKVDNTPAGVATTQDDVNASVNNDGNLTTAVKVAVRNDVNGSKPVTQLEIPAGTVIKDENNQTVKGDLKVTVTAFSADEENATQSFPGGFAVLAQTSDPNATTSVEQNISFVTAGFTSVVIKNDAGQKVKTFSQPIEVKMQIKEGTKNPDPASDIDGDGNVSVGDIVPVWSYEETTGVWSFEQNGTVKDLNNTDGFLDVVVNATHLSYWNLDWHYSAVCSGKTEIDLVDSSNNKVTGHNVYLRASFKDSSGYLYSGMIYGDGFATMYNVPKNKPMIVKAYTDSSRTQEIGSLNMTVTDNDCNNGKIYTVAIDTSKFPIMIDQKVKVTEYCKNGKVNREGVPNLYTYAYSNGHYAGSHNTDANGEVTYSVEKNKNVSYYLYLGYYDSVWTQSGWVSLSATGSAETLSYSIYLTGNTEKCLEGEDTGSTGGTGEPYQDFK